MSVHPFHSEDEERHKDFLHRESGDSTYYGSRIGSLMWKLRTRLLKKRGLYAYLVRGTLMVTFEDISRVTFNLITKERLYQATNGKSPMTSCVIGLCCC
jgi:hypothetical protein